MNKKIIWIVLLLLLVFLPYFLCDSEHIVMTPEVRVKSGLTYIKLKDGYTRYEYKKGASNLPVVVLVHGYSSPCQIWDPVFNGLVEKGYPALRYDLFGRGMSDKPEIKYSADVFDKQLQELLDKLSIKRPVYLAGISMGGAISAVFTAKRDAGTVAKLALLAPYGIERELPVTAKLVTVPGIGHYLMMVFGGFILTKRVSGLFYEPEKHKNYFPMLMYDSLPLKGFKHALRSTVKNFMQDDIINKSYKTLAGQKIPVLFVWGDKDKIVPYRYIETAKKLFPGAEYITLKNTGHIIPIERPKEALDALDKFFKGRE